MTDFTSINQKEPHSGSVELMMQACEAAHEIHLTLHDHVGFFKGPDGLALIPSRKIHWHPVCQFGRQQSFQHCSDFCQHAVPAKAKAGKIFISHCWKGLSEVIIPLHRYDIHVGTLYAGAWQNPKPEPLPDNVRNKSSIYEKRSELPNLEKKHAHILSRVLSTWAEGLMDLCEHIQGLHPAHQNRASQIRTYIFKNAHKHIQLEDLGNELGCSASRAGHICNEELEQSFQELLINERIQRAQTLLSASPSSIAEIAEACGFGDVYYFSRAFKKRTGLPPGQYRKQNQFNF